MNEQIDQRQEVFNPDSKKKSKAAHKDIRTCKQWTPATTNRLVNLKVHPYVTKQQTCEQEQIKEDIKNCNRCQISHIRSKIAM